MVLLIAGAIYRQYASIRRGINDREQLAAVVGYALPVLAMLVAFRSDAELGMTLLAILAFGDGSATLVGKALGGPRLPWNHDKSWSGFLAFLTLGSTMATVIYWGEANNPLALNREVGWSISFLCASGAALAAAVAESLPAHLNDNIRVAVTSAITLTTLHALLT
jgi:dolichol kinase